MHRNLVTETRQTPTSKRPPARERIETAARDLMARRGVDGTTTQDIAKRARCSQAAIYKHWDGKESLARSLYESAQGRLTEAMETGVNEAQSEAERVLGALDGLLRFARREPEEFAFLFQVFHSDYVRWSAPHRKPRDILLDAMETAMAAGEIPEGRPATKTAMLLGMAIRLAFLERQGLVEGPRPATRSALAEAAAAVLES